MSIELSFFTTYAFEQFRGGRFKNEIEAFRHFVNKGVTYGDVFEFDLIDYPMSFCTSLMHDAGMKAGCLISILDIAAFDPKERAKNIALSMERIDQMEKLGIPMLMAAPAVKDATNKDDFEKTRELLTEGFAKLSDYAESAGITVAIENQSIHVRPDSSINDVKKILDAVPKLGYILDVGNFFCVGEDPLKGYEMLADRLVHVHGKDWKYDRFGSFVRENMARFEGCAYGTGDVPMEKILHRLKADGYHGNVVIEVNGNVSWETIDESIDFTKRMLMER